MRRLLARAANRMADWCFTIGDMLIRAAARLDPNNQLMRELDAAASEWDQGHNNGGTTP